MQICGPKPMGILCRNGPGRSDKRPPARWHPSGSEPRAEAARSNSPRCPIAGSTPQRQSCARILLLLALIAACHVTIVMKQA